MKARLLLTETSPAAAPRLLRPGGGAPGGRPAWRDAVSGGTDLVSDQGRWRRGGEVPPGLTEAKRVCRPHTQGHECPLHRWRWECRGEEVGLAGVRSSGRRDMQGSVGKSQWSGSAEKAWKSRSFTHMYRSPHPQKIFFQEACPDAPKLGFPSLRLLLLQEPVPVLRHRLSGCVRPQWGAARPRPNPGEARDALTWLGE